MHCSWGQGKIEVRKHQQEILALLADGLTENAIFKRLQDAGLEVSKPTFYRAVKEIRAEQPKAVPPHIKRKKISSDTPPPAMPSFGDSAAMPCFDSEERDVWGGAAPKPILTHLGPYGPSTGGTGS